MKRMLGKTAVVTGSTRGIGRAIAIAYGREGANVVVTGTKAGLCQEVAETIKREGVMAVGIPADISDWGQIQALYDKTLETFGEINVVVNNAGIAPFLPFLESDRETLYRVWNVNVFGTYFSAQRAANEMVRQGKGGKIINMSSISEETAAPLLSMYASTKAAIKMMTKCMAVELARHRINVNAIGAGVILTDINREALKDPVIRQFYETKIPWGRIGQPKDIVGAAVFLASDEAEYVTGTTLFVDGGFTIE